MFIIVQIPFADLRPVIAGERGRLRFPDWAADEPKGFLRGFGKISLRNSSGLGLVGERRFVDMGNAIRFPERIEYVRLIDAGLPCTIAFARHSGTALAPQFFVPCFVGMVFADPPYAKTNGADFIHERAAPAPKIAGIPREATPPL